MADTQNGHTPAAPTPPMLAAVPKPAPAPPAAAEDADVENPFDGLKREMLKALRTQPALSSGKLVVGWLMPMFEEMRAEYFTEIEEIEERLDALESGAAAAAAMELLEKSKQLVVRMAGLLGQVSTAAGYVKDGEILAAMPADVQTEFKAVQVETQAYLQDFADFEASAEDEDEDEDEDDADETE